MEPFSAQYDKYKYNHNNDDDNCYYSQQSAAPTIEYALCKNLMATVGQPKRKQSKINVCNHNYMDSE